MEKERNDNSSNEKPKIEIEINKYKRLVDVLNNPKMLAKAIVVLAVVIVLVFVGVSAIALIIKRFYPPFLICFPLEAGRWSSTFT